MSVGDGRTLQTTPAFIGLIARQFPAASDEIELGNSQSPNAKDLENEESYSVVGPPVRIVGTWSSSRRQRVLNLRETNPTTSADAAAPPAPTQAKHEEHGAPEQTNDGR